MVSTVPEAFRAWNAERATQGARLREAIAAILQQTPRASAREIRRCLIERAALPRRERNGHLVTVRVRAIQLHMAAIRSHGVA